MVNTLQPDLTGCYLTAERLVQNLGEDPERDATAASLTRLLKPAPG
jgi:hypothetical protein